MTLFRQLIIAISVLVCSLLAINLVVSVMNARLYFHEQMQNHSEDTATSLALSISRSAAEEDDAQLRSLVDVIFDRGYYRAIIFKKSDGSSAPINRTAPIAIEGVPEWFINLIDLPEPVGKAEVSSGWSILGDLIVVGNPGYAYRDLWRVFKQYIVIFIGTALVCYVLVAFGLRLILRPLDKVESQAEAICRREFPVQDDLPRTIELRRVVIAMNRMVEKVQAMFQEQVSLTESLYKQAHLDPVTQLSNRQDFDSRLRAFVDSERSGNRGVLFLLEINGLIEFNDHHGRDQGDDCLRGVASTLLEVVTHDGAIVGRRSGADFAVFIPELEKAEAERIADEVINGLSRRSWYESKELVPYLGAVHSEAMDRDNNLFSHADMALRQAQHHGEGGGHWLLVDCGEVGNARPAGEWSELISSAITKKQFTFHYQPVYNCQKELVHLEVLCRLPEGDSLLSAGEFWPMVERFHLSADLDRVLIEMLAEQNPIEGATLCVNLSPNSLHNKDFTPWLEAFLADHAEFAKRLQFELPAQMLEGDEVVLRNAVDNFGPKCAGVSLDHFGVAGSEFMHLQSINICMLKVDMRFTHSLESESDSRFYVETLLKIARSCDLSLYVEGIETKEQWAAVQDLGLDGGQGYYLGRPSGQQPEQ